MRITAQFCVAAIAIGPTLLAPLQGHAEDLIVFAAASLTNALDQATQLFERHGGAHCKISYAASSTLAKQIESGAPADIFISADLDWMNYLGERHLIRPSTRRNLLGNQLALIAPADSAVKVELEPGADLAALLKGGRL
ncbi:MAG TPA: molybdate ABC transporter substrate-binding protein, partial [Stellaceae bacterium]|nr:molybdate ABC transporter substrate-binding protein [Stellaceae bacterium]